MTEHPNRFSTRAVHAGTNHIEGAVNTPVFLSSTYRLTEERYAGWAAGAQHTMLYTRLTGINAEATAAKIAALEGAEDGELFASGMAAISATMLGLLSSGDHIVASPDIYGGTYGLVANDLPRFGIEVTLADIRDPESYRAAIRPETKMIYCETLTNPTLKVCDLDAMGAIAEEHDLMMVVDNTFASPWGCTPLSHGAHLVIHSTTKYLNGHSDIIGGAVVGNADLVSQVFKFKINHGGSADPMSAYLTERGARTLHARMPIHTSNAAELARRLDAHPAVAKVIHVSMPDHPDRAVADRILPKGSGMLSFILKGGDDAAVAFMRRLELVFEATSLGGIESLIECPFNSSHMFIPEDVRIASGILPGFVRMSVGIEDVEDLWSDISQALE